MKQVLLAAVLLTASFAATAQKSFFVRGGVNFAGLTNDEPSTSTSAVSVEINNRTGYNFSVGRINQDTRFDTKLFLTYSSQGGTRKINNVKEKIALDYAQLNFSANLFDIKDKLEFWAGPQVGYLIGAKSTINSNSVNTLDSFAKVDFGVNFEVAYPFNKAKTTNAFFVWNLGFNNIPKGDRKGSNNVFQLGLEFVLGRKKK